MSIDNTGLFIDNKFVNSFSGKTIDVYDPRNDQVIVSVAEGDEQDINVAIDSAYDAFHNGPWYKQYTGSQRARVLMKFADLVEQNLNEIALLEAWDVGKPIADANQEIALGVNGIRYFAGFADKIHGDTLPVGLYQFILYSLYIIIQSTYIDKIRCSQFYRSNLS